MYKAEDMETLEAFVAQYPFAILSGCDPHQRPVTTQLPVFMVKNKGERVLHGHMIKGMDHTQAFRENEHALVVFTGKHAYVSARWYTQPQRASTVNYMSVHVRGKLRFLGASALEDILRKTTLVYEGYNESSPTVFDQLPRSYTKRLMRHIVAFEIKISSIDSVFKLSQDQDQDSFFSIIEALKKESPDARALAAEMEKRADQLFPG